MNTLIRRTVNRWFWLAFLVALVFDLVIVMGVASYEPAYDIYPATFTLAHSFDFIGALFEGFGKLGLLILGFVALGALTWGAHCLTRLKNRTKHIVTALSIVGIFILGALIGVNWMGFSFRMLVPLFVVLFIVVQTWAITAAYSNFFTRRRTHRSPSTTA